MRRSLAVLAVSAVCSFSFSQMPNPDQAPLKGARSLALSPDGSQLAFVYKGDIWVAPSGGGRAVPVTTHPEFDTNPIWSPDGKWIAFASNRAGGNDVFVVPSAGGTTRRLTWFPGSDIPQDWSPDGRSILITGTRDQVENSVFTLDVATTQIRLVMTDNMTVGSPRFSPDGRSVFYNRFGFPWSRPRYQGSSAAQLWSMDVSTGARTALRNNGFQHLWPSVNQAGVFAITVADKTPSSTPMNVKPTKFVDSAARTPNVYQITGNGQARRLTEFVGGGVRFLTAARNTNRIAFEYEGDLYVQTPGQAATKISVVPAVADEFVPMQREVFTTGAGTAVLSPDGSQVAFVARDDIWLAKVRPGSRPNDRDAQQLTTWAGLDGNPLFSPDGKTLFFTSDREGSEALYSMSLETKTTKRLSPLERDVLELRPTPDGKGFAFWQAGSDGGMFFQAWDGGSPKLLLSYPRQFRWETDTSFSFSPDMRFVAFSRGAQGFAASNIMIADLTTKEVRNVTQLNTSHTMPLFSADGKYLYFDSDRGPNGLFILPLTREAARTQEEDRKYAKPEGTPKTEIDFTNIQRRIQFFAAAEGFAARQFTDPETGALFMILQGDVTRVSYDGKQIERFSSGGGVSDLRLSNDRNSLIWVQNGEIRVTNIRQQNRPTTTVAFRAEWRNDLTARRRAAFTQFWREYNRGFYDPNFHGRDWEAIRERYEPLLDSVGTREEMATLLNMMVGELEASHAEVSPAGGAPSPESVAYLGMAFDYTYSGPGIRVQEVFADSPGSFASTQVKKGEYILEINGAPVRLDEALWRDVLVGQVGRDVSLLVNDKPTRDGARTVRFVAMSSGEQRGLIYEQQVAARRAFVEQMSNGQIAYVHIAGMGQPNLRRFNLEAWELINGKRAVIIDVRWNGGGNISDSLVDLIERRPNYIWHLRDSEPFNAPDLSWDKPTVVLAAETSLSNAEMFPYTMKQRKLGTYIGMPTPGYVIGTYGLSLVDGTGARMPTWGVYQMDGQPMENNGIIPDIQIPWTADQWLRGEDPQLKRAVEELMRRR